MDFNRQQSAYGVNSKRIKLTNDENKNLTSVVYIYRNGAFERQVVSKENCNGLIEYGGNVYYRL